MRTAEVERNTKETQIRVRLNLDGKGAAKLKTGIIHINDQTVADEPWVPFGGRGASGNGGRHGGIANWEEFTQWQWVTIQDKATPYPF